jgi:hypothetical protein
VAPRNGKVEGMKRSQEWKGGRIEAPRNGKFEGLRIYKEWKV